MTVNPVLIALAVKFAGNAPTLASALSTSAFNLGTAVGSWIAGRALETELAELGPPVVGTVITTLTLVPLAVLARAARHPGHRPDEGRTERAFQSTRSPS